MVKDGCFFFTGINTARWVMNRCHPLIFCKKEGYKAIMVLHARCYFRHPNNEPINLQTAKVPDDFKDMFQPYATIIQLLLHHIQPLNP